MSDPCPERATTSSPPHGFLTAEHYVQVRERTVALAAPLGPEDSTIQSMEDCSPTKWHLAHTTWFFETFVLAAAKPSYRPFHAAYRDLFNSYYNAVGEQYPRARRGLLSRPTLGEVHAYREAIDERMTQWLQQSDTPSDLRAVARLGLHHEMQHQELLITDAKHALSLNPLGSVYRADSLPSLQEELQQAEAQQDWVQFSEGLYSIGANFDIESDSFSFDNEGPKHQVFLPGFALARKPVTVADFREFIDDGGYQSPQWWLSEGWSLCQGEGWKAPLYSRPSGQHFTLAGIQDVDPQSPVTHLSYFEADAYARWTGARLPSESEWEIASHLRGRAGAAGNTKILHPRRARETREVFLQMMGDVWEWTASPYTPYPSFRTPKGAVGEYNGKFMCNQMVLRGGSCASAPGHLRPTYRNFFPPHARWQFSGIRLAKDLQ